MKRLILTNQHTDNRGDESATIGAVKSLRNSFGEDTEITLYLPATKYNFLPQYCNVTEKHMIIGIFSSLEMLIWILFKFINIDIRRICSKKLRDFIEIHDKADIVISSCGGPYIGDIYINHEIIHIMHLVLPLLLGKQIAFFAPSMGPFNNRFMNIFRKYLLNRTSVIIVRDHISYQYVKDFLPNYQNLFLTTDACLADDLEPSIEQHRTNTIGITPLDYKYPLSKDVNSKKLNYETNIVSVLDKLMELNPSLQVEFFPQLFANHSDLPFINYIISKMRYPDRTIVFSDQRSGREQQNEIASLDYMIATRYHSAIFACKVNTPVVGIAYEHKIVAFMKSVNLEEYLLDIYSFDEIQLMDKIELLRKNSNNIKKTLEINIGELKELSKKSAELIYKFSVN